jgi:CHAT domain-containing protein/tetratricopeptide (TPR) repeat protein
MLVSRMYLMGDLKLSQAEEYLYSGQQNLEFGNHLIALFYFEQAIALNTELPEAWEGKASTLRQLGRYEEAIPASEKAIALRIDIVQNNADFWFIQGYLQKNAEDFEQAITYFNKACDIQPNYWKAFIFRGSVLINLERYEDALSSFAQAIDINPEYYEIWGAHGDVLTLLNRYEDAIISFNQVIKYKPDFGAVWTDRGYALANLKRYEDAILNCNQGLTHVLKESQPENWGRIHHCKGDVYYYQAKLSQNIQTVISEYSQALESYEIALQTLDMFPEEHLELIQSFIKTYLGLANPEAANQWRIDGLEVFRQLLNAQPTPQKKRGIEAKFSGFSQIAIDALVSAGNLTVALEAAERYKNRCLSWILDEWQEQVISPSYTEIRELLDSNHEIIYWHLSEETLTTFILTPNQEPPIVLTQKSIHFESWQKDWDKRYSDYHSKGKAQAHHLASHPWRVTLKKELDRLKDILEIDTIETYLSPETQLILIPHRDLHRFPLHVLFGDNRITTYLPSIKVGLAQKPKSASSNRFLLNVEDPTRPDQDPLEFAQLESAILQAVFPSNMKVIAAHNADRLTVETALNEHHSIFHFTGHGEYNARQPEQSAIGLTDTERLTAKEISALKLQQYELVCLSACETALTGRQAINTEYVGLSSAFLQAGVSQIVSTLWNVKEDSNAYLMIRFYQLLKKGMTPAEALKRSQFWLSTRTILTLADWLIEISQLKGLDSLISEDLKQRAASLREDPNNITMDLHHPPYENPYHWAAFTLTGRGFL